MRTKEQIRTYKRDWSRKKKNVTKESLAVSATWKGRRGEMIAKRILQGSIDMNKEQRFNYDFDLLWDGKRVDVKTCNLYKRKLKRGKPVEHSSGWWVFNKNKNEADLYMCICMVENVPEKYYLVPAERFSTGITIGQRSVKYDTYQVKL